LALTSNFKVKVIRNKRKGKRKKKGRKKEGEGETKGKEKGRKKGRGKGRKNEEKATRCPHCNTLKLCAGANSREKEK
jgi:hypothetical protein